MHFARPRHSRSDLRTQRWIASALALGVFASLVACTGPDTDAPPARTTVEKIWTAAGIDPVSQVEEIGGVAVVYGTTPGGLMMYGLDPSTGVQLWSRPATMLVSADYVSPGDVDGSVAYFRPSGTERVSFLVLADPKTGSDLSVSAARSWYSSPKSCEDDEAWSCLKSYVQSASGYWDLRDFRVNKATGETRPDGVEPSPEDGFTIDTGGLSVNYHDEMFDVSRQIGGSITWTKPGTELFGADTKSIDRYSTWTSPDDSYTVMWIGGTQRKLTDHMNLATDMVTAAFNLADGTSRWIMPGSVDGCLGHHPGLDVHSTTSDGRPYTFRCRFTGTATYSDSALDGSQTITSNLGVTLERFDPRTGEAAWAAELGDARTLAGDSSTGAVEAMIDDQHLYVSNSAGGVVIDLETGTTKPVSAASAMWCKDVRTFARPEAYFSDDSKKVVTANRWGVYRPCTASGQDAALPITSIPSEVATEFDGDLRVAAVSAAVSGFLVPPAGPTEPDPEESSAVPPASQSATTAESSPAVPPPATPVVLAPEQVWASEGFEPLTTPTVVGHTAVVYGTIGSDLFLIGLDPQTGAWRWRQQAWAGGFSPSTEITVREIDGLIAYLRPTESLNHNSLVVLADPDTGTDRMITEERWWTYFPSVCTDDEAFLCSWSYAPSDQDDLLHSRVSRIERSTGAVTIAPEDPEAGESFEPIFGRLVKVTGAPTETVGVEENDSLLWSAPVADLLGGAGTFDDGWIIGQRPGTPPVIYISGQVGWQEDPSNGYPTLDLTTNLVTVAVNAQTGSVIWREPSTSTICRARLGDNQEMSTPGSSYPSLRCRYSGQLSSSPRGGGWGELTVASGVDVTLERIDVSTGKAIWSVPLGDAPALAVDSPGSALTYLDDHRILVNGQVIDVDTGLVRPAAANDVFWCPGRQNYRQTVAKVVRGESRFDRAAGGEVFLCDAGANPVIATPTGVPLAVSAMTDDGMRLVSTKDGVVAYRVPL